MAENLIDEPYLASAVSNIAPRSERQPDLAVLRETYVETGVLPQVHNYSNQILYGRRGTGKSHVLQVLGSEMSTTPGVEVIYLDVRLLGSAHLFQDESRHPAERCVAVFKDLLSLMQAHLLDLATNPEGDGSGIQEVSEFADFIVRKTADVTERTVKDSKEKKDSKSTKFSLRATPSDVSGTLNLEDATANSEAREVAYTEALRETLIFSEVYQKLDQTLKSLNISHLVLMVDEWTSLPVDMQPFVAEFFRRTFFPSVRVTVKIGSLEYRSRFTLRSQEGSNPIGFELGADITANLDLDDYYVYERNPEKVTEIFRELLYKHVKSGIPEQKFAEYNVKDSTSLRSRLFTEHATFTELVRAGEGVVRDFLGIFGSAYFKARASGRQKIDLHSVEEAARDWYETDKSTELTARQRAALQAIITDVIGSRQTKMFMLPREDANHAMIQSLFDLRLLHLISRGYSDKEKPGQRYNIYALDYGTFVDLKRTKAEPEDLTESSDHSEEISAERIVPFADKRSIRRVILQTEIFDALQ